ncbi:MAG: response regulator transcription factor [Spirochaetia bacterium]|nr:response regulator transcription factor [Spirochaetia bacterium]
MKTEKVYKISMVEDSPETAERIQALIDKSDGFDFIANYSTGEQALKDISESKPDLIILDIDLPGISGIELVPEIKKLLPDSKILMYTVFENEDLIIKSIKSGANGYILKDTDEDLFIAELKVLMIGGAPVTPRIAMRILSLLNNRNTEASATSTILSDREKVILNLISLGLKYSEVAEELGISIHTVRRHIENIYKKMDVGNKTQAIIKGKKMGILE